MRTEKVILSGTLNDIELTAHITETEEESIMGLSGTDKLGWFECMVFELEEGKLYIFHTKKMKYPIDIVEFNEDQEVIKIHHNVQPGEVNIPINADTRFVVEFRGGFCNKFTVEIGDKIFINDVNHDSAIGEHSLVELTKNADYEGIQAESPDYDNQLVYYDKRLKDIPSYNQRRLESIIEQLRKSHEEFDIHSDEQEPRITN